MLSGRLTNIPYHDHFFLPHADHHLSFSRYSFSELLLMNDGHGSSWNLNFFSKTTPLLGLSTLRCNKKPFIHIGFSSKTSHSFTGMKNKPRTKINNTLFLSFLLQATRFHILYLLSKKINPRTTYVEHES